MKENRKNIRLTALHFCFLFVLLGLCLSIKVQSDLKDDESEIAELIPESNQVDIISDDLSFVLFYDEHTPSVRQMEKNLHQLSENEGKGATFYKVNGVSQETISLQYGISGFPTVLILKNGEEFNRTLGVVSYSNLKHIYGKVR